MIRNHRLVLFTSSVSLTVKTRCSLNKKKDPNWATYVKLIKSLMNAYAGKVTLTKSMQDAKRDCSRVYGAEEADEYCKTQLTPRPRSRKALLRNASKSPLPTRNCDHRDFHTRFNFVFFVLLAESMKFCGIRKPCTYTRVCDNGFVVQNFIAYESPLEYEIFTRTKISAITVQ